MTVFGAYFFLHERLNYLEWLGIFLVTMAVAWTAAFQISKVTTNASSVRLYKGITFAFFSVISNVSGTLLSGAAFSNSDIEPLWAAFIRLGSGVCFLLVWKCLAQFNEKTKPSSYLWLKDANVRRTIIMTVLFAAFCTYLGIVMQQASIKFAKAGIASTLMETDTLFTLCISVLLGYKISRRELAGILIAIVGILLLNLKG